MAKKEAQTTKRVRTLQAKIVDLNAGESTIRVEIEDTYRHERYEKLIRSVKEFLVHLPEVNKQDYTVGDVVTVVNVRPISKLKHWKVAVNTKTK